MKIIEPSVELWEQGDNSIAHVTRCARVCYGRESGNDEVLYNNLIKNKHWSMFRHDSVYAIIPTNDIESTWSLVMTTYLKCPYIHWITFNNNLYIVTNGNFLLDVEKENLVLYKRLVKYRVTFKEFKEKATHYEIKELFRYTFKVTTQISTSRELNRVSPNNIAEQSTRYVYENGTICKPHWYNDNLGETIKNKYISSCSRSFREYKELVNIGLNRQDARGVLPLDTATVCVYTYSIREWRNILDLRYYGTTGKPHPNTKIIASMIRDKLIELGYKFK